MNMKILKSNFSRLAFLFLFLIIMNLIEGSSNAILTKSSSKEEKDDRDFVLKSVGRSGRTLEYASDRLKKDEEIVLKAIEQERSKGPDYSIKYAHAELVKNRKFFVKAVKMDGDCIKYGTDEFKSDKEIALEAAKNLGTSLEYVNEELRNDKEIVLAAVEEWGGSLEYASEELKNDREIVFKAVKNWGSSLHFASEELKNDKEIVLTAVKKSGDSLDFASEELRNDIEFKDIIEAVEKVGGRLRFTKIFRNDREYILKAAKYWEESIKYASEKLLNDKNFILAAIVENGVALKFANFELKNDLKFVRQCVKINGDTMLYIGDDLKERYDENLVMIWSFENIMMYFFDIIQLLAAQLMQIWAMVFISLLLIVISVKRLRNFIISLPSRILRIILEVKVINELEDKANLDDYKLQLQTSTKEKNILLKKSLERNQYVDMLEQEYEEIKRKNKENIDQNNALTQNTKSLEKKFDECQLELGVRDFEITEINKSLSERGKIMQNLQIEIKHTNILNLEREEENRELKKKIKEKEKEKETLNTELEKVRCKLKKKTKQLNLKKMDISYRYKKIIFEKNRVGDKFVLGSGNFGKVFKVEYNKVSCAFKILDGKLLTDPEENEKVFSNLEKEVFPMCVEHRNILKIIGYSKFIEYEGLTIKENMIGILTELGKYDVRELILYSRKSKCDILPDMKLFLLYSVSNAMKFLHSPQVSIMHRDLKWENVLILEESGRCVLCDFGVSKEFLQNMTNTNTFGRGSYWFIAPEIIIAEEKDEKIRYNQKCDVFSFSIMTCQLLYGLAAKDLGKYFYSNIKNFKKNPKIRPQIDKIPNFFNKYKKRNLDSEVIGVMKKCWSEIPSERPTFNDLTTFFRKKLENTEEGLALLERDEASKRLVVFYDNLKMSLKNKS